MSEWWKGRLLAFDVETTGVDPEEARIVTAALAHVGGGGETDLTSTLVDPGVEIPAGATEVHGITTDAARAGGLPAPVAVEGIVLVLRQAIDAHIPVVIFNARYDLTVLDRECRRHGVEPPNWNRIRVVDPFVLDKFLHRFRRGKRTLSAMCEHYGVVLEEAHEAGADAVAAARLAWYLARKGEVVAKMPELVGLRTGWKRVRDDLDMLHGAQVNWAHEQARSLQRYFDAKGQAEHVETAWPVVPFMAEAVAA